MMVSNSAVGTAKYLTMVALPSSLQRSRLFGLQLGPRFNLVAQGLSTRSAINITDQSSLGILELRHQLVPIGLRPLAVTSPRRQELDKDSLACHSSIPIVLGQVSARGKNHPLKEFASSWGSTDTNKHRAQRRRMTDMVANDEKCDTFGPALTPRVHVLVEERHDTHCIDHRASLSFEAPQAHCPS